MKQNSDCHRQDFRCFHVIIHISYTNSSPQRSQIYIIYNQVNLVGKKVFYAQMKPHYPTLDCSTPKRVISVEHWSNENTITNRDFPVMFIVVFRVTNDCPANISRSLNSECLLFSFFFFPFFLRLFLFLFLFYSLPSYSYIPVRK